MHPDFKKILQQFKDRYGDEEGENLFYAWINKRKLDDTKPYSTQAQLRESFNWAKPLFSLFKKDRDAKYYRVEAGFPVNSMNENIYTEDELLRATASLPGKHIDLNHNLEQKIGGVEIVAANYEDGAVETVLRVLKDAKLPSGKLVVDAIDGGEIDHVSIEADCEGAYERADGYEVVGLKFTGLALLDQEALPGIPLTRLMPLESIREGIFTEVKNIKENDSVKEAPKTDEQRAMSHFKLSPEDWAKLSDEEKKEYIDKLPPLGSNRESEELEAIAEKNKEIADLADEVRELKQKLDDVEATVKVREDELHESKKKITKLQKEKADIMKDIVSHKKNLDETYQELSETKQRFAELQGKYDSLAADLEEEQKQVKMRDETIEEQAKQIGGLTSKLTKAKRDANELSADLVKAKKEALSESTNASEVQQQNADLSEDNAKKTREISELSRARADLAKKTYLLEQEIAEAKQELEKRDKAINEMKTANDKALRIQKQLYKVLQKNGIYEVDEKGNLLVH